MEIREKSCNEKHTSPVKETKTRETIPEIFKPTLSSKPTILDKYVLQDFKRSALKPRTSLAFWLHYWCPACVRYSRTHLISERTTPDGLNK